MQITTKAINAIRKSNKAKASLMTAFDMTEKSVLNWLDKKDVRLTTPTAIDAIKSSTGLKDAEIIHKEIAA